MKEQAHLRLSLGLIAAFLAVGLWLEAMYGLRARGWMDDELRREFLRLGHAHGGILGLLNVLLNLAIRRLDTPEGWASKVRLASWIGAALVGLGFMTGGLWHGPTDPGPTVLAVPAGALMVLCSLVAVAIVRRDDR